MSNYRIEKAKEALEDAETLAKIGSWNGTVSRLYYACFYIANAYLISKDNNASTHSSVKNNFHQTLIKTDKLPKEFGELYQNLFDLRHDADYRDFNDMEENKVKPFLTPVKELIEKVEKLINTDF